MTELTDKTVGRYQIKELIGEGAMAKVYRAYDPEINRSLAFKILKSDLSVNEEYLSRFLREAKAAGALSHSNIVTVYDVGEVESLPYIMMELLPGNDLGEMLNQHKTFSVKDTLTIALQLANALNYAHELGVIHRDIKPENIMVLEDGLTIKVADFGIARMSESEDAQKTQIGSVLGTPRYMSPEQALGQKVDGRSDLYSIGVILYEMLTGIKAFDAANIGTLMTQIIHQQPTSLKQAYPELPSGVRQIVQKLLSKKPEKRYQTGRDLASAIAKELEVYSEQQENQQKNKYIPLKVRWTAYMGAIVALVMLISVTVVFNIQSNAMTRQAVDSGTAFAKFVAIETAVSLLSEDWITLETFINEAANRKTFSYLIVTDREGIVRGASDITLVGQEYEPMKSDEDVIVKDGVETTSLELPDGSLVFNLEAPILFQNVTVGQIVLGLSQESLENVQSITGWLMFVLALITIASVSAVLYIFGELITQPLRLLNDSMKQLSEGDFDSRISLTRNDEIGEIFETYNNMASNIQQRIHTYDESALNPQPVSKPKEPQNNDKLPSEETNVRPPVRKKKVIIEPNKNAEANSANEDQTIIMTSLAKDNKTTKKDNKSDPS